jgi:SAM-dependent methyltransferase
VSNIDAAIRARYGAVAASDLSSDHAGVRAVAAAFGYTPEDLAAIPAAANMGLSCGNPVALASLRPGEVVLDLGCGGGLDVFLAAAKVGPAGRAIGVDMTPAMIERARANAAAGPDGRPYTNVEFLLARIDALPLPDASVDCVISNCVINLAPDKSAVFREIARVLRPGGRLAVSDIALKRPLPPELAQDVAAYVGCIAGAILIDEYRAGLHAAGFGAVEIVDSGADLNVYAKVEGQSGCCSPAMADEKTAASGSCCAPHPAEVARAAAATACCTPSPAAAACCEPTSSGNCCSAPPGGGDLHRELGRLLDRHNVNDYAASVKVFAVKPA